MQRQSTGIPNNPPGYSATDLRYVQRAVQAQVGPSHPIVPPPPFSPEASNPGMAMPPSFAVMPAPPAWTADTVNKRGAHYPIPSAPPREALYPLPSAPPYVPRPPAVEDKRLATLTQWIGEIPEAELTEVQRNRLKVHSSDLMFYLERIVKDFPEMFLDTVFDYRIMFDAVVLPNGNTYSEYVLATQFSRGPGRTANPHNVAEIYNTPSFTPNLIFKGLLSEEIKKRAVTFYKEQLSPWLKAQAAKAAAQRNGLAKSAVAKTPKPATVTPAALPPVNKARIPAPLPPPSAGPAASTTQVLNKLSALSRATKNEANTDVDVDIETYQMTYLFEKDPAKMYEQMGEQLRKGIQMYKDNKAIDKIIHRAKQKEKKERKKEEKAQRKLGIGKW